MPGIAYQVPGKVPGLSRVVAYHAPPPLEVCEQGTAALAISFLKEEESAQIMGVLDVV